MGQSNSSPGKGDLEIATAGNAGIGAGSFPDTGVSEVDGSTSRSIGATAVVQNHIAQLADPSRGPPDLGVRFPLSSDGPRRRRKQLHRQRRIRSTTPLTPSSPQTTQKPCFPSGPFVHQLIARSDGELPPQVSVIHASPSGTAPAFQPVDFSQNPFIRPAGPPPITAPFAPPVVHFGGNVEQQQRHPGANPQQPQQRPLSGGQPPQQSAAPGGMTPLFLLLPQEKVQLHEQVRNQNEQVLHHQQRPQEQAQQQHLQQQQQSQQLHHQQQSQQLHHQQQPQQLHHQQQSQQLQQQQQLQFQFQQPALFFPVGQTGSHVVHGQGSAAGSSSCSPTAAPSFVTLSAPCVSSVPASVKSVPAKLAPSTFAFSAPTPAPQQSLFTIGVGPSKDGNTTSKGAASRVPGKKEHPAPSRPHVTVNNPSAVGGLSTGVISHTTYTYAPGTASQRNGLPRFPPAKGTGFPLFRGFGKQQNQQQHLQQQQYHAIPGTGPQPPQAFDFTGGSFGGAACTPAISFVPFQFGLQSDAAPPIQRAPAFSAGGERNFASPAGGVTICGEGGGVDDDGAFALLMVPSNSGNPANPNYTTNSNNGNRLPASPQHNFGDRQTQPPFQELQQRQPASPQAQQPSAQACRQQHSSLEPLFEHLSPQLQPPGAPLLPLKFAPEPVPDFAGIGSGCVEGLADSLASLLLEGGLEAEGAGTEEGNCTCVGNNAQYPAEPLLHMPGIPATANYYDPLFAPATGAHISPSADQANLFAPLPPLFHGPANEQLAVHRGTEAQCVSGEMPVTRVKASSQNRLSRHSVGLAHGTANLQNKEEMETIASSPRTILPRPLAQDAAFAFPTCRGGRALSDGDDEPNRESDGSNNSDDYSDDDTSGEDEDVALERRKARGFVASDRGSRARRRKLCRSEVAPASATSNPPVARPKSPLFGPVQFPDTTGTSVIFREFVKKEAPLVVRSRSQGVQSAIAEFANTTFDFAVEDQDSDDMRSRLGPSGKVRQGPQRSGMFAVARAFSSGLPEDTDESAASGTTTDQDLSDNEKVYELTEANVMNIPQLLEDSEDLLRWQQWKRELLRKQQRLQMQQAQHLARQHHQQQAQQQHLQMERQQLISGHAQTVFRPAQLASKQAASAYLGQLLHNSQAGGSQASRRVHPTVPPQMTAPAAVTCMAVTSQNARLAITQPPHQRPVLQAQATRMPEHAKGQPQQPPLSSSGVQQSLGTVGLAEAQKRIPANTRPPPPNAFVKEKAGNAPVGTGAPEVVKAGAPIVNSAVGSRPRSVYLGKGPRPSYEVRRRKFLTAKPTDWICAFCEYEHAVWPDCNFFACLMGGLPDRAPSGLAAGAEVSEKREGRPGKKKKKKKKPVGVNAHHLPAPGGTGVHLAAGGAYPEASGLLAKANPTRR